MRATTGIVTAGHGAANAVAIGTNRKELIRRATNAVGANQARFRAAGVRVVIVGRALQTAGAADVARRTRTDLVVIAAGSVGHRRFTGRAACRSLAIVARRADRSTRTAETLCTVRALAAVVQRAATAVGNHHLPLRAAVPGLAAIERATLFGRIVTTNRIRVATGNLGTDIAAGTKVIAADSRSDICRTTFLSIKAAELIAVDVRRAEMMAGRFIAALRAIGTCSIAAHLVTAARRVVCHLHA